MPAVAFGEQLVDRLRKVKQIIQHPNRLPATNLPSLALHLHLKPILHKPLQLNPLSKEPNQPGPLRKAKIAYPGQKAVQTANHPAPTARFRRQHLIVRLHIPAHDNELAEQNVEITG